MKKLLLAFLFLALLSNQILGQEGGAGKNFYFGYQAKKLVNGLQPVGLNYEPSSAKYSSVFTNIDIPTSVYRYESNTWVITQFDSEFGGWDPDLNAHNGDAYILQSDKETLILAGEVPIGEVSTVFNVTANGNWFFFSSKLPVSGRLKTDLGFPIKSGDAFYKPKSENGELKYDIFIYDEIIGGWYPTEPILEL